jgi:hypothetical protein
VKTAAKARDIALRIDPEGYRERQKMAKNNR